MAKTMQHTSFVVLVWFDQRLGGAQPVVQVVVGDVAEGGGQVIGGGGGSDG